MTQTCLQIDATTTECVWSGEQPFEVRNSNQDLWNGFAIFYVSLFFIIWVFRKK